MKPLLVVGSRGARRPSAPVLGLLPVSAVVERRNVARVWLVSAGTSLVALFLFMFVRTACHECLTFPSVAVCERRNDAVDTQIES